MSELQFFTTQELIAELMNRRTFCGVVVHSADEHRSEDWPEERIFKVHHSRNLDADQAGRLLEVVGDYLKLDLS